MTSTLDPLLAAATAARIDGLSAMSERELLQTADAVGSARRSLDALAAEIAGELARRSERALGYSGLAQRNGMRTAAALVQRALGSTAQDARQLVAVGAALDDGTAFGSALGASVRTGAVSVASAAAIRSGLGDANEAVSSDDLAAASTELVAASASLTPEQLRVRARERRDELDAAGVADRETALRARRSLRLVPLDDGMTRLIGLLDPESAAQVSAVVDAVTSPRRGGPRFVDPAQRARADALDSDPRTTEQLALDGLLDVLRAGAAAAPESLPASGAPVRVVVAARDLPTWSGARSGTFITPSGASTAPSDASPAPSAPSPAPSGSARLEGQAVALSSATAERRSCADGIVPIVVDAGGQPLDVGRAQRLFTSRQRIALAVRDGGCRFPGCDRPPSWCEAHHLVPWSHGGRTDTADGILLCRHHHLLLHDNGWRAERDGARYFVVPPAERDPLRRRIPAPPKSRVVERAIA
jgi:hypothetical protein